MDDDTKSKQPASNPEVFKEALKLRQFEIEMLWKRTAFYWTLIGAAFVAYGVVRKDGFGFPALMITCFGFVCSVAWTFANRGAKFWQENFEAKAHKAEGDDFKGLLTHIEPAQTWKSKWLGARTFSVSRLAIGLSDFTAFLWLMILAYETIVPWLDPSKMDARRQIIFVVMPVLTVFYSVVLLLSTRTKLKYAAIRSDDDDIDENVSPRETR